MSIANYSELKTAIENWTDDTDAAAYADDYIGMVEARLNSDNKFRFGDMEANDTLTLDSAGEATLPTDFLELRRVDSVTNPVCRLQYVTPQVMAEMYPTTTSGWPRLFTIEAGSIRVRPVTTSVKVYYYQELPPLSDANTTNWLLTKMPQVYLYGCEAEHAWKYRNYERGNFADSRFLQHIQLLHRADKAARWPNATARVTGVTP